MTNETFSIKDISRYARLTVIATRARGGSDTEVVTLLRGFAMNAEQIGHTLKSVTGKGTLADISTILREGRS